MTLLDANILLYAYNADCPQHRTVAPWLKVLISGSDVIGLPWPTIWAFLRISTNPRVWPNPITGSAAFQIIRTLMSLPGVMGIPPGPRHAEILEKVVTQAGATGALMSDAVMAAMAIENGATLASTDRDFNRFKDLRWINPLDLT